MALCLGSVSYSLILALLISDSHTVNDIILNLYRADIMVMNMVLEVIEVIDVIDKDKKSS